MVQIITARLTRKQKFNKDNRNVMEKKHLGQVKKGKGKF